MIYYQLLLRCVCIFDAFFAFIHVGEWGCGVEGKQVGSMDEESQVRGCYNITFICIPTNLETVCIGKDTSKQNI